MEKWQLLWRDIGSSRHHGGIIAEGKLWAIYFKGKVPRNMEILHNNNLGGHFIAHYVNVKHSWKFNRYFIGDNVDLLYRQVECRKLTSGKQVE